MALLLTGKWEHALLAAAVREAGGAPAAGYLGRTALQKVLYFLKIRGVPMRYEFDIYHYGPYCDAISRDVEWLMADEVVKDQAPSARYSNYRPGPACAEIIQRYMEQIDQHRPVIQEVIRALLPLEPERLELMATLDFVHRQCKAADGHPPRKDQVIERFRSYKGGKFSTDDVSKAYDSMCSAGLLD